MAKPDGPATRRSERDAMVAAARAAIGESTPLQGGRVVGDPIDAVIGAVASGMAAASRPAARDFYARVSAAGRQAAPPAAQPAAAATGADDDAAADKAAAVAHLHRLSPGQRQALEDALDEDVASQLGDVDPEWFSFDADRVA